MAFLNTIAVGFGMALVTLVMVLAMLHAFVYVESTLRKVKLTRLALNVIAYIVVWGAALLCSYILGYLVLHK